MNPATALGIVDRMLTVHGQSVILRRITGTGNNQVSFDAQVRAWVTGYLPQELSGSIIQGDSKVILSPTDIKAAGWPGPNSLAISGDIHVPRKGDKVVVQNRERTVMADGTPWYITADGLFMIVLQTRGQQ